MKNLDESSGPYFPFDRRETYPRRIKVDFRRLPRKTLLAYAAHHELHLRPDITHEELAIAAARHFAEWRVNEDSVIRSFCSRIAASTVGAGRGRGNDAIMSEHKRKRDPDVGVDDSRRDLHEVLPPPMERSTRKAVFVAPSPSRPEPPTSRRHCYRSHSEVPSVNELHSRDKRCPPSPPTDHAYGDSEDDEEYEERVEGEEEGVGEEYDKGRRVGRVGEVDPHRPRRTQCERKGTRGDSNNNSLPRCSTRGSAVAAVATDGTKTFTKGEQVAAYVTRSEDDSEGASRAWILARVIREKTQERVELHDEDDTSHMFQLPASDIIRLQDMSSKVQKHDKIMAVFPDTTMFYCATVAKDTPRMDGNIKVMLVSFEDDEDEHGKVQIRRVPVDHMIFGQGRTPTGTRGSGSGGRRRGRNCHQQGNPRIACSSSRSTGGGGAARSSQGGAVAAASRGSSGGNASGSSVSGSRVSGRTDVKKQGTKAGKTYADMISYALTELGERGSYTDICTIVQAEFSDILNWKVESDIRKTPVWKSSVRKILFSNNRFTHCASTTDGHVFAMA